MAYTKYSTIVATTLTGTMTNVATSAVLADASTYPDPVATGFPYTVIIGYGSPREEICTVTAKSGNTLTVTRAQDGTTGTAKNIGDTVVHGVSKRDWDDLLAKAGGTMTGEILLSGNPSNVLGAAPKQYVDARVVNTTAGSETTSAPSVSSIKSYADTGVSNHAGAADPHTGYQKESEKAAANGYASLDGTTKVPYAQVPTGTAASTVAIGDHNHSGVYDPAGTAASKVTNSTAGSETTVAPSVSAIKSYADTAASNAAGARVAKTGDTMSGELFITKDAVGLEVTGVLPAIQLHNPGTYYSRLRAQTDGLAARTGDDLGYTNLSVLDPTSAQHAASKTYVDARVVNSTAGSETTSAPSVNSIKTYADGKVLNTSAGSETAQAMSVNAAKAYSDGKVLNTMAGTETTQAPSVNSVKTYVDKVGNDANAYGTTTSISWSANAFSSFTQISCTTEVDTYGLITSIASNDVTVSTSGKWLILVRYQADSATANVVRDYKLQWYNGSTWADIAGSFSTHQITGGFGGAGTAYTQASCVQALSSGQKLRAYGRGGAVAAGSMTATVYMTLIYLGA